MGSRNESLDPFRAIRVPALLRRENAARTRLANISRTEMSGFRIAFLDSRHVYPMLLDLLVKRAAWNAQARGGSTDVTAFIAQHALDMNPF